MTQSLELLRESLPYIRRFKGKTFVVKLSGKVTDDSENLMSLAQEIALLHQVGIRVCVVHGGGRQLTELAGRLGVAQTVVEGRRVTDDETLDLAKMVFAGKINTEILAALRKSGIHSVGLSGIDGGIINAAKRPPREYPDTATGGTRTVDFGNVGDILSVDTDLLRLLLDSGYLPVVSSLAADEDGAIFNINADTIASEIAVRLRAEKLVLLSDVDGIYGDPGEPESKVSRITPAEAEAMIAEGRLTDGMVPKVEALVGVINAGVGSVHIINGQVRNALLEEVFTDEGTGTMLTGEQ